MQDRLEMRKSVKERKGCREKEKERGKKEGEVGRRHKETL